MNFTNKLLNFPSVYCTTLEESIDRQNNIKKQFIDFDINTNQIIPSKRYQKSSW